MLPGVENESKPTRGRAKASAAARRGISPGRIIAIGTAFCVILIGSIYIFHQMERFLIRDPRFALTGTDGDVAAVEIAGANHASRARIERVFAIDVGRSIYLLPLSDRREALRSVDWVRDASIARIWPNRVVVSIRERKPVAFVTLAPSRFGLIDEDGMILPPAPDRFELPVLSGVLASDSVADRRDRVRRMLRLTRDLGDETRNISEVDVSDRDNLKVTVPRDGHIVTLLLGDRNYAQRYQSFLSYFSKIKRSLPNAATLDLRLDDRITAVE